MQIWGLLCHYSGSKNLDSGYVAQDDLETVEKHLTYQSARFIIECITGHPDYKLSLHAEGLIQTLYRIELNCADASEPINR